MGYWSLITEVISFLLLVILILNLNYRRRVLTPAVRCFWAGLFLAAFCIVWNIMCTLLLKQGSAVPLEVNLFANTVYFILAVLSGSVIALFVFGKMLEHVYDQHCMKRAVRMVGGLTVLYAAAVLLNLEFGFLFWFDAEGTYHRGPLNSLGYAVVAAEMVLMVICYFRHRVSISKEMKRTIRIFSPMVLALMVLQIMYPEFLLNGIIAAFVELILFLGSHSQKRGFDSITGLGNRNSFFSDIELRTAGEQRFQVYLVTLASFSVINNRYGHQTGNEFLYSVASWLENLEKSASVYRYIGVTCAVVMPCMPEEERRAFEDRLQERFEDCWTLGAKSEKLQAVFGHYVSDGHPRNANYVMEALDYLLSVMKRSDHLWIRFDRTLSERMVRQRKIFFRLREALNQHAFEVWYQPVLCLEDGSFCSAEALVRMKNEDGEYIPPSEFIPIAETAGMIDDIFWLVLRDSCRLLSSGTTPGLKAISVNLSMTQLENPRLDGQILEMMKEYGISREQIKFEITEQQLAGNPAVVGNTIHRMLDGGFCFYLDDFGVGYSNASAVAKYDFECIKLDRSLVGDTLTDSRNRILLENLLRMFHDLGMGVVAEGVETREQMEYLAELGTEKIQGFYYARPMPVHKLTEFLRETV